MCALYAYVYAYVTPVHTYFSYFFMLVLMSKCEPALIIRLFSCINIIRLDTGFHSALSLYLGDGIKKDMEMAANGETVLEELQKLLASTSSNLIV